MSDERFIMAVMDSVECQKEISILDTEEDNVQLFCCECEDENLFFVKQEFEQVIRMLNFQDSYIKKLSSKIDEQNKRIEGLEHQIFCDNGENIVARLRKDI